MQVFISYSSTDRPLVKSVTRALQDAGIEVWRDQLEISAGENYGPLIVDGIKAADALLLCCSRHSVASKNVKQEVQLAWTYGVPCLPILLDGIKDFAHLQYWLAGIQYVDLTSQPADTWMPDVLKGLEALARRRSSASPAAQPAPAAAPPTLASLQALARFTDRIWPEPYPAAPVATPAGLVTRDLGALPSTAKHAFRRGDRVLLRLEIERAGHLLVLDEGTSGTIYCLAPSLFRPGTPVAPGVVTIPGAEAAYPFLQVSGAPGLERLLAIVVATPPPFDLAPRRPTEPARTLDADDCSRLTTWLSQQPADTWIAMATEFEILP